MPLSKNKSLKATSITAAVFAAFSGFLGIEHGVFETTHGNNSTGGLLIDAIRPLAGSTFQGSEPAFTLIPNYLLTGSAATAAGLGVIIWALLFLHRRSGSLVVVLLSVVQLMVGGGLAPIFLAIPAALAATRIDKPLPWWRKVLPEGSQRVFSALWLPLLVAWFAIAVLQLAVAVTMKGALLTSVLPPFMFAFLILTIVSAFAHDITEAAHE